MQLSEIPGNPTLDVKDVADYLKISVWTVKNRLRAGELKGYKQGIYWRIKREWLLEYEASLIAASAAQVRVSVAQ
jgi:excisionase family DNA binding protein